MPSSVTGPAEVSGVRNAEVHSLHADARDVLDSRGTRSHGCGQDLDARCADRCPHLARGALRWRSEMSATTDSTGGQIAAARPVVFRGGTVLTMDDRKTVLRDADVLVVGERIEAVGQALDVPDGTLEVDATGGIVMPGMIDTHRHMWQTAMRGYGADWTLTQYFVWYYLEHG